MLSWAALICLAGAVALLAALSLIDLKTRLLPNELVLSFAILGVIFHLATLWRFMPMPQMFLGGMIGFGSLYALRAVANKIYDADTLGLGDVKLMGAAGLWLGMEGVMLAMTLGATVSLLHGLLYAAKQAAATKHFTLSGLALPAGPGFACGIAATGAWLFSDFRPELFWVHP